VARVWQVWSGKPVYRDFILLNSEKVSLESQCTGTLPHKCAGTLTSGNFGTNRDVFGVAGGGGLVMPSGTSVGLFCSLLGPFVGVL
jgi:hypothetical protein